MEVRKLVKKKIIIRGPLLSQSGYGVHARFVLRALRTREDIFDIYVDTLNWGKTSWLWEDTEERRWVDATLHKTMAYRQAGGQFDVSLQVTIPNEWEKIAAINIGCTAGIETTKIAPQWVEKSYLMDKIIVVSEFAKQGIVNTVYEAVNNVTGEKQNVLAKGPVDVINYCFNPQESVDLGIDLTHDFNFLLVSQWSVRKNFENSIRWFMEEFIDQEVGLVIKASFANNSHIDFLRTKMAIEKILMDSKYVNRKCSLHLVHGYMSDQEMSSLYQHPKIKALINIAHGEGFGLPIFEAAGYGLPVITISWGGQTDFLYVPTKVKGAKKKKKIAKFAEVSYSLAPIQDEAVWDGVLHKGSMWAYADQGSFKMTLREVYKKYSIYKKRAAVLKGHILKNFSPEGQYKKFTESIGEVVPLDVEALDIEDWLSNLNVEEHA